MQTTSPLSALRQWLCEQDLDGIIVPRADAFQSEYCAPHDNQLAWLTGFDGSAGHALILQDRALMFVDGRYQVQVREQVDLQAFEILHLHNDPLASWLRENVQPGSRIAFEAMLMTPAQYDALLASQCVLVPLSDSPFDHIWQERPAAPVGAIREMPLEHSGESSADKRQRVAALLDARNADYLAITQPDNIAWLLNVRGSDIPTSPVPNSFALLGRDSSVEWFVNVDKTRTLSPALLQSLTLSPEGDFLSRSQQLSAGKRVMMDADTAPVALRFAVEKQELLTCQGDNTNYYKMTYLGGVATSIAHAYATNIDGVAIEVDKKSVIRQFTPPSEVMKQWCRWWHWAAAWRCCRKWYLKTARSRYATV
jgi:Xaa-Pro aminopeptidase